MAIQKTEAFVLKTQPFRSSSLIVTFFSRSFGKLRGVVKGVRKEREMRGAAYENFTHLEIIFYEKLRSDLHLVSEASILTSHDVLRRRLDTIAYASYFAELVDRLCEVHDPQPRIFELLDFAFRFLSSIPGEKLSRLFEIKFLQEIGWIPYLERCLNCQASDFEKGFFSISQGAVFCPVCASKFPDARPITLNALSTLRYYALHPLDVSLKFHTHHATEKELEQLMRRFLLYRLGDVFKSQHFMDQIQPVLLAKS